MVFKFLHWRQSVVKAMAPAVWSAWVKIWFPKQSIIFKWPLDAKRMMRNRATKGWVAWCRVQSTLLEGLLKPSTQLNSLSQMLLIYNQFSRPSCVFIELRRKGAAKGLRTLPGEVYTNHNHYLQGRPPGKKNSFSCSLQLLLGSSHHFFQLCSWVSTSMQRWSALKNCRHDYSAQCPRQPSAGQHAPTENTTFWKKELSLIHAIILLVVRFHLDHSYVHM